MSTLSELRYYLHHESGSYQADEGGGFAPVAGDLCCCT